MNWHCGEPLGLSYPEISDNLAPSFLQEGGMSYLTIKIDDNFSAKLAAKLRQAGPRAAHALAAIIHKDTDPFVPALNLRLSGDSKVIDNKIIYPGPYARYLYNGKVMVDAATGKGPMKIVGKDGSEIIRFRKGAKLKPTSKDLDIKRHKHKQAQSHWIEGSKAQNLDKWIKEAGELVADELQ